VGRSERTKSLTRSADDLKAHADGAPTGAEKEEARRRNGEVKDVGVQTDDLQFPGKEQAS
jgi:hypothetical protein